MDTKDRQELGIVRGGQYARPGARKAIEAERLMRERFYALRCTNEKAGEDRTIRHIAEGSSYPTRRIRALLARLKAKQIAREAAWAAVIEPMHRVFENEYGKPGQHTPAA